MEKYEKKTVHRLFYESLSQNDKMMAVHMAAPFFTKKIDAATVITNAASGRCGCEPEVIKEAGLVIYQALSLYIDKLIHKNYPTYLNTGNYYQNQENREDMHAAAMIKVLESAHRYSGKKSVPITFFGYEIMGALSEYTVQSTHGGSRAEAKKWRYVKKACAEMNIACDETASVKRIQDYILAVYGKNVSSRAIKRTLIMNEVASLEMMETVKSQNETPEEYILRKESESRLGKGLMMLDDQERACVCLQIGIDPETLEINSKEVKTRKELARITGFSEPLVKQKIVSGYNKMRNYYSSDQSKGSRVNCVCVDSLGSFYQMAQAL